jgi:peptide/nickel transport system substrate-binding protein
VSKRVWQLLSIILVLAMVLSACGGDEEATEAPAEPTAAPVEEQPTAPPAEEQPTEPPPMAEGCPPSTLADPMGLEGDYRGQFELAEYEAKAGCTMTFSENPDIAKFNGMITNNPELPPVEERLPAEPLVLQPYFDIGKYGGQLDGISNATEAGTSDLLSVRHVNLVRFDDDYLTIKPDIAKGWEWNDDFTEITFFLREGHKWSDGQPFTAADVAFWFNDVVLSEEIYQSPPARYLIGDEPWKVDAIDDTTVKFSFAAPTPGILTFFATTFGQPFLPKHFFEQYHIKYNPDADALAAELGFEGWGDLVNEFYGASDWTDVPSPLLKGSFDFVKPTLEGHILVADTADGRHLVPNPYFHQVDTVGNQLPYISEIDETYLPDIEVQKLKMTSGEVDYKTQGVLLEDYPLLKENEELGGYETNLAVAPAVGQVYAFNTTHKDPGLYEIFNDVRFRRAMSLAINRDEINEIVYLGQGIPGQFVPADPATFDVVLPYTEVDAAYDPEQAKALLDEMGLVDTDGDGFREKLDGSNLTILLQYSTQETSPKMHELVRDYWADVGVRFDLKEVTSDEYRTQGNNNDLDLTAWGGKGIPSFNLALDPEVMYPPFGGYFNPGTGFMWAAWVDSAGAEGVEPPEDALKLYDLKDEFVTYALGTDDSNRVLEQITKIHTDNLWLIGTVGRVPQPNIHRTVLKNFNPFSVWTSSYWAYAFRPTQWYFDE